MDESYIAEILEAARKSYIGTKAEFDEMTRPDINAGYRREVEEAKRRHFKAKARDKA